MQINLTRKRNQHNTQSQSNAVVTSMAWLMFVIMSITLSGCGNKGDLYLPEKDETKKQQSTEGVK